MGFKRDGVFPTTPSVYTATTTIPHGQTINLVQVTLEAGNWLLIAAGRPSIPSGTITFDTPINLRYSISSASQTYANGDAYLEYNQLVFQSQINGLPVANFTAYVQPSSTVTYYLMCSPLYGDGTATTFGTNMKIGSNNKLTAIRVG